MTMRTHWPGDGTLHYALHWVNLVLWLSVFFISVTAACKTTSTPSPQDLAIDELRTTQHRLAERVDTLESEMATKEALAAFDKQIKHMIEERLKVKPVVVEKPRVTPIFRSPSANR